MKATVESAGKVASRVRLGAHELVFDQPATVPGGDDRGPSPLDVLAVSVAGCAHYYAAAFLHGRGLSTEGLAVDVESEKERTPTPRLGRISLKVRLPAGLSDRHLAGIERAIKSCPAYGTLLHPPSVSLAITSVEVGAAHRGTGGGRVARLRPQRRRCSAQPRLLRVTTEAQSDESLLAAARGGERSAIEALLERYQDRVFGFGLRMCGDTGGREGRPPGDAAGGRPDRARVPRRLVGVHLALHDRAELLHQEAAEEQVRARRGGLARRAKARTCPRRLPGRTRRRSATR